MNRTQALLLTVAATAGAMAPATVATPTNIGGMLNAGKPQRTRMQHYALQGMWLGPPSWSFRLKRKLRRRRAGR